LPFCFNPARKNAKKGGKPSDLTGPFETGPYYKGLSRLKSELLAGVRQREALRVEGFLFAAQSLMKH
jgi:hypothetical protein